MPRFKWCALVIAAACGTDVGSELPDGGEPGGGGGGGGGGDAGPAGDGGGTPDAPWSICRQATLHDDLAWIQQHVFTPSCAVTGCHTGSALNLTAGASHASLVNRSSSVQSGWVRVVPGSVAQSYLAVALGRADGPPPPSGFMPLGAPELCVEKLEAIERWIAAGAEP